MPDAEMDVDAAAIESPLGAELNEDVVGTEVLHDGLNLSIAISTADAERAYVLRRPNKLRHTDLFTDLDQEYGVMRRLGDSAVPAPEPVSFCEDESILGDRFFVMTYLDGDPVPLGTDLPDRFQNDRARARVADGLIDTLADVHSLDADRFDEVCDRIPPGEQIDRTVDRLETATSVTGHDPAELWDVAEWLQGHVPSDATVSLVHGDYRPGNVLFAGTDQPTIAGVLDWETAMVGDPLTELGYLLLRWRDEGDPTPSLSGIESRHPDHEAIPELREANEHGLAPFTTKPGSPARLELVARYEDETGIAFENDRFYRALAAFGLATVWADLDRFQVEAGSEPTREPHVEYMSLVATSIVDGELAL